MHQQITVTAAALRETAAKLTELRARMAAAGDVTPYSEIQAAARGENEPKVFLVLGCGESAIPAVREGDNDPENWTVAAVIFHRQWAEWQSGMGTNEERCWCVLVTVAESDLDSDAAVVCHREILDFDLALGACRGFEPRDPALRNAALGAMRDAGAIE